MVKIHNKVHTQSLLDTSTYIYAYVLFTNEPEDTKYKKLSRFIRFFTCDEYRHCKVAIRKKVDKDFDVYILVDGTYGMLDSRMVYSLEQIMSFDATIVEVTMKVEENRPMFSAFWSCVEVVKRSLGIYEFFTITPYQLYKSLLTNYNGRVIKER